MRWSDNKQYEATELGMGENFNYSCLCNYSLLVHICLQGNAVQMTKAENDWTSQQEKPEAEEFGDHGSEASDHHQEEEEPNDHDEEQASK